MNTIPHTLLFINILLVLLLAFSAWSKAAKISNSIDLSQNLPYLDALVAWGLQLVISHHISLIKGKYIYIYIY